MIGKIAPANKPEKVRIDQLGVGQAAKHSTHAFIRVSSNQVLSVPLTGQNQAFSFGPIESFGDVPLDRVPAGSTITFTVE